MRNNIRHKFVNEVQPIISTLQNTANLFNKKGKIRDHIQKISLNFSQFVFAFDSSLKRTSIYRDNETWELKNYAILNPFTPKWSIQSVKNVYACHAFKLNKLCFTPVMNAWDFVRQKLLWMVISTCMWVPTQCSPTKIVYFLAVTSTCMWYSYF